MTDLSAVDHLVIAGPDLAALGEAWADATGLTATPGGVHVDRGTRNELVGIDATTYIELIGPDPDQPDPAGPRSFGIDRLNRPRFITFAMAVDNVDEARAAILSVGTIEPGETFAMQRARPDGVMLKWRLLTPPEQGLGGVMPFFIEWGDTPHPAASLDQGAQITTLQLSHPRAGDIAAAVKAATGTDLPIVDGDPALRAGFTGPAGTWEL